MTDWLIDCLVECCSCIQSSGLHVHQIFKGLTTCLQREGAHTGNASGDGTKTHLHRARARHSD